MARRRQNLMFSKHIHHLFSSYLRTWHKEDYLTPVTFSVLSNLCMPYSESYWLTLTRLSEFSSTRISSRHSFNKTSFLFITCSVTHCKCQHFEWGFDVRFGLRAKWVWTVIRVQVSQLIHVSFCDAIYCSGSFICHRIESQSDDVPRIECYCCV